MAAQDASPGDSFPAKDIFHVSRCLARRRTVGLAQRACRDSDRSGVLLSPEMESSWMAGSFCRNHRCRCWRFVADWVLHPLRQCSSRTDLCSQQAVLVSTSVPQSVLCKASSRIGGSHQHSDALSGTRRIFNRFSSFRTARNHNSKRLPSTGKLRQTPSELDYH